MTLLAAIALAISSAALGYTLGRRQDRRDIHRAPIDYDKAIERLTTDETKDTHLKMAGVASQAVADQIAEREAMSRVVAAVSDDVFHNQKVKRAARKPQKRRR